MTLYMPGITHPARRTKIRSTRFSRKLSAELPMRAAPSAKIGFGCLVFRANAATEVASGLGYFTTNLHCVAVASGERAGIPHRPLRRVRKLMLTFSIRAIAANQELFDWTARH